MTDILLITDVPRLRKVFSRLSDENKIRLRIANRLERGGEEIAAEKPDMVFVQTHLSGLSGDILLMHLKKQLGRRRSRFVLLGSTESITPEVVKLYHHHLDTSLPDNDLFAALQEIIRATFSKEKKVGATLHAPPTETTAFDEQVVQPDVPSGPGIPAPDAAPDTLLEGPAAPNSDVQPMITYSPPSRLRVYSEFTNSFETAVSSLEQAENDTPADTARPRRSELAANFEVTPTRSKKVSFLLWFAPLLLAVVAVTMLQNHAPAPKTVDIAPGTPVAPAAAVPRAVPVAAAPPAAGAPVAAQAAPKQPSNSTQPALAEKISAKEPAPAAKASKRPVALPDFIPRYGYDKQYGVANPGWERYKGEVTEFKIFRENGAIKAIQVIDRGGLGVPESFMKGVLRQLARKPDFSVKSSVKKDGYEIQRGQVADSISTVYYRDADNGKLRAFVVTW